jgi:hypothetical protein
MRNSPGGLFIPLCARGMGLFNFCNFKALIW